MKRILTLLSVVMMTATIYATDYDKLWANVKAAEAKDMPRDAMAELQKIIHAARGEHEYGECLAASIYHARIEAEVTPDSLSPVIYRLHDQAVKAEAEDTVLAAVYYTVMARLCNLAKLPDDDSQQLLTAQEYYDKALSHPDVLSSSTTQAFKRLINKRSDDEIFNNDLLSFIGHQAGRYEFLKNYYNTHGNRRAACIEHLKWAQSIQTNNDDLGITHKKQMLNDGMAEFADMPESALFANEYFNIISHDSDISEKTCYSYLKEKIKQYEVQWNDSNAIIYTNVLRNSLMNFTRPKFDILAENDKLIISNIRNASAIDVEFHELNANGKDDFNLYSEKDKKRVMSLATGFKQTVSCTYNNPEWETHCDTVSIPRIPYGVYLVKASTGDASKQCILYYSDLSVLTIDDKGDEDNPRIIVISKTTGAPVRNATVDYNKDKHSLWVSVNKKSGKDLGFRKTSIYNKSNYYSLIESKNIINVFTDRSIYRPGQTVKGAILVHNQTNTDSIHTVSAFNVNIRLKDADDKEVAIQTVTTDKMGNAGFEFLLPKDGKNGAYSIVTTNYNCVDAYHTIMVEEYKRPTFEVNALDAEKYEDVVELDNDSNSMCVDVRFKANTYSQTPLQATVVTYSVVRGLDTWFGWRNDRIVVNNAQAQTNDEGIVTIPLTLTLPEMSRSTFNFSVNVSITDQSGETHEASLNIKARHKRPERLTETKKEELLPEFEMNGTSFPQDGSALTLVMRNHKPQKTYAFYTIHAGKKLIESSMVTFTSEYKRDFCYKEEYGEALLLTYIWVMDGKEHRFSKTILKPQPDLNLPLVWTTFRDHTQPGSMETWTCKVGNTDHSTMVSLTASIYDMSLDALCPTEWKFDIIHNSVHSYRDWRWLSNRQNMGLSVMQALHSLRAKSDFNFAEFYEDRMPHFSYYSRFMRTKMTKNHGAVMKLEAMEMPIESSMVAQGNADVANANMFAANTAETVEAMETVDLSGMVRQEISETAFFTPSLLCDEDGNITLSFKMPETMTTWRMRGFVHDTAMRTAWIDKTCVASKSLIVKPNVPRFLRKNDKATMAATISNTTEKAMQATVTMQFIIPETNAIVWQKQENVNIDATGTTAVYFETPAIDNDSLLVYRIAATSSDGATDGEQHYIPVLQSTEIVETTFAFTLHEAGTYQKDISDMLFKNSTDRSLCVRYTPNAIMMIKDAIPTVTRPERKDAMSLAAATYVSTLFNNDDTLRQEVTKELRKLQLGDGSWPWWEGMKGTVWNTTCVARLMARLEFQKLGNNDTREMLRRSLPYLMDYVEKEAASIRKLQREHPKEKFRPSETCTDILYIFALCHNAEIGKASSLLKKKNDDITYLLNLLEDCQQEFTIYGKAHAAVLLGYYGRDKKAKEHLESMKQYSVNTEETGRHFDSHKAHYSWRNYRIPTQVAAIEALRIQEPHNTKMLEEMKRWLLHEKRTQQWDNSINTADAVYAFMLDNDEVKNLTDSLPDTKIMIDGVNISTDTIVNIDDAKMLTVEKTTKGTSWGGVFVSQRAPLQSLKTTGSGFKIRREIITQKENLNVGDRITVRITIDADRDYDYVEVCDHRAACFEPVEQLSGYRSATTGGTARFSYSGYYRITHDNNTEYFFDKLAKGTHVIETDYYVDRSGTYTEGTCTVKCSYAPEYGALAAPETFTVNK